MNSLTIVGSLCSSGLRRLQFCALVIVPETGGASQINGNIRMYIFTRMLSD